MWSPSSSSTVCGSAKTTFNARKIKILVCTANMGNAEPDIESLSAWIPRNGCVEDVLDNPKYPVPEGTNPLPRNMRAVAAEVLRRKTGKAFSPQNDEETNDDKDKNGKFDIVVIGMQEATFDVADGGEGMANKLFASQVMKATSAVKDWTRGKDHLKSNAFSFVDLSPKTKRQTLRLAKQEMTSSDGLSSLVETNPLDDDASQASYLRPMGHLSSSLNSASERLDTKVTLNERAAISAEKTKKSLTSDTKVLHAMLTEHLPSYKHAVSYQRGQMRLLIFYNDKAISMDVISIKAQNTGKGGLANKGGIVSEVLVDGTTRIAFFTAHLEAHEGLSKYETRCSSVADIFRGTSSSVTEYRCDASLASHYTFAMGDLNFRTRLPHNEPGSEAHIVSAHAMANGKNWDGLHKHDELISAIKSNHCFSGFSTPVCSFPPTFKVLRQRGYVYNEKRSPSYTDRILYTAGHKLSDKLKVLAYEPIDDFATSDHKPIRGAFEVELNPRLKWRPTLSKKTTQGMSVSHGIGKQMPKFRQQGKNETPILKRMDHREFLHFFITSIKVNIFRDTFRKSSESRSPSPFVCFISTPPEALKTDTRTWDKLKRSVQAKRKMNVKERIESWPKTRPRRSTFEASWDNEDVHFKVRTHMKDGMPIDLSGAMIHVAVFDSKNNGKLVGAFPLNLAYFISQSRQQVDLEKTKNIVENQDRRQHFSNRTKSMRNSLFSLLHRIDSRRPGHRNASLVEPEDDPVVRSGMRRPKEQSNLTAVANSGVDEGSAALNDVPEIKAFQLDSKEEASVADESQHGTKADGPTGKHWGDSNEEENNVGTLTAGPSSELLRHACRTWLGSIIHGGSAEMRRSSIESFDVRSMKLNRPLRKFGIHVGTVEFTVDSWWLSDEAADEKKRNRKYANESSRIESFEKTS